jgi:adenosylmethionine-8-amino-7-oxononanoate aminotransferase
VGALWGAVSPAPPRPPPGHVPGGGGTPAAVVAAARHAGVLVYSGTGNADGVDGDTILLGPPFVITDPELERVADVVAASIDAGTRAASGR